MITLKILAVVLFLFVLIELYRYFENKQKKQLRKIQKEIVGQLPLLDADEISPALIMGNPEILAENISFHWNESWVYLKKDSTEDRVNLYGSTSLKHIAHICGVDDLEDRINRERKNANFDLENTITFGVSEIRVTQKDSGEEKIEVELYRTDKFTQLVLQKTAQELMQEGGLEQISLSNQPSCIFMLGFSLALFFAGKDRLFLKLKEDNSYDVTDQISLVDEDLDELNCVDHKEKIQRYMATTLNMDKNILNATKKISIQDIVLNQENNAITLIVLVGIPVEMESLKKYLPRHIDLPLSQFGLQIFIQTERLTHLALGATLRLIEKFSR